MTSHELANLLLSFPDMPVATHAHGHTYHSVDHRTSHGPLKVVTATLGFASNPPTMVIGDVFEHVSKEWHSVKVLHGWPVTPYAERARYTVDGVKRAR